MLNHLKEGSGKAWAGQLRLSGCKALLLCELISEILGNLGPDNPIGSKTSSHKLQYLKSGFGDPWAGQLRL